MNPKWTKEGRKEYDRLYAKKRYKHKYSLQRKRIKENCEWFQDYKKSLKCSKCPENHPACLQFHHKKDKLENVSNMVGRGWSRELILLEIEKCIVICANCHAKEHYNEKVSI